jgi:hypothetical protein
MHGCSGNSQSDFPMHFVNDIDSYSGWNENPSVIRFNAHSGNYVCQTSNRSPYSITFKSRISEITQKPILRAQISAWVYAYSTDVKGSIVCAIDSSPGKGYIYFADNFSEKIQKKNTWTKVSSEFYFPKVYTPDFIFSAYLWNAGTKEIFVDDMEIRLTSY